MQVKKLILAVTVAVGTIAIVYFVLVELALRPACDVTELSSGTSPDGTHVSSVFRRDCGATTSYVTGVALRGADHSFSDDSVNVALIIDGDVPVEVHWKSDSLVEIAVPPSAKVFKNVDQWNSIDIALTYQSGM